MVDVIAIVAVLIVAIGVVGTVVPMLPGALLSLAGIYLYWWNSGFAEPGTLALAGFTVFGLAIVAIDYLGGAISARVGGASWATTALAAVVGFALFFLTGPIGILLGVAGTVFAVEFYRNRDGRASLKTAGVTTVGMLASNVAQVAMGILLLLAFLVAVLL